MTSETDQQFMDRVDLDLDLNNTADIQRLFALARRGAAAAARIEQLEAALRDIIIHCDWPDRVEKYARAALGEERT